MAGCHPGDLRGSRCVPNRADRLPSHKADFTAVNKISVLLGCHLNRQAKLVIFLNLIRLGGLTSIFRYGQGSVDQIADGVSCAACFQPRSLVLTSAKASGHQDLWFSSRKEILFARQRWKL